MQNNEYKKPYPRNNFRDHEAEVNLFIRRIVIAFIAIFILLGVLLATVYHLQITRYQDYSTRSNDNRIKIIPIAPDRGRIFDRNGIPLSINQTIYNLEIIPDKITDLDEIIEKLRAIIDLNDDDLTAFYKEKKNTRRYTPVTLKTKLTEEQISRFMVEQHRFPFIEIKGYQHRYYPYGEALVHVLGYVSKINDHDLKKLTDDGRLQEYTATKNMGKLGIERYYESTLHGKPGYAEVEVDSRGRIVRQLSENQPTVGQDIYLTIDLNLQLYIQRLLSNRRASVVVMDPNNGEVLAFVSSPAYDPNLFVGGISSKNYKALLENPDKPLYNRVTQGTYPPASTVKPFVSIAALSTGVINKNTVIHDVGWWQLPKSEKRYRDWRRGGHGRVDLVTSIASSVDTFYYQIAYNMGIDRLSDWMKKFGFGQHTGIDLSSQEEQTGVMPTRAWKLLRHKSQWLQGDTIPVGIGQGYWTATPLQLVKALTTLINNGDVKTPHLMLKAKNNAGLDQPYESTHHEQNIVGVNLEYWQLAKLGMNNVLHGPRGTARRIFARSPYLAAGKSGTAQVYGLKKDEVYNAKNIPEHLRDHALFIAYAPYENPKVAMSIILENGGGGSANGGAVAKDILDYVLLGVENNKLPDPIINRGRTD